VRAISGEPCFEQWAGKLYNTEGLQSVQGKVEPTHMIYITYLHCIILLHVQKGTENGFQLSDMLDNWSES